MAKCGTLAVASSQFDSSTPKLSSIISERSQPGVSATAVHPWGASLSGLGPGQPDHRCLRQVVEQRDPVVLLVVLAVPSVISTTSPPSFLMSRGRAKWLVVMCVSMASRSNLESLLQECSHTGTFHPSDVPTPTRR